MEKNVLIPRSSLVKIIEILEHLDSSRFSNRYDYFDILFELKIKMRRLDLRDAYEHMIHAVDDETKNEARLLYFQLKNQLRNIDVGELPF